MTPSFSHLYIKSSTSPTSVEQADILRLTQSITLHDNTPGIEEKIKFRLDDGARTTHLLALHGDRLVGYAHFANTGSADGLSCELLVAPEFRRQGIGSLLSQTIIDRTRGHTLRFWVHGSTETGMNFAGRNFWFFQQLVLLEYHISSRPTDSNSPEALVEGSTLISDIANLIDTAYGDVGRGQSIVSQDWFRPELTIIVNDPGEASMDGVLILRPLDIVAGNFEIHAIAVQPKRQGKKIGHRLIRDALVRLQNLGANRILSYVNARNVSAMRAHVGNGFNWCSADCVYRTVSS
jgi:GNAT superfamily N-acetyltransferase